MIWDHRLKAWLHDFLDMIFLPETLRMERAEKEKGRP